MPITNYKSGIDVVWGVGDESDEGTAYAEEYFYHDKLIDDHKVVFIRDDTPIRMATNARNVAFAIQSGTGVMQTIGINGLDGIPNSGDEGIIRYKLDRDRQYYWKWTDNWARTETAKVLPAYTAPFTLASQVYEPGVPVVGTTGFKTTNYADRTNNYVRGIVDSVGDEWHVLAYAHDSNDFLRPRTPMVDQAYYADDGKTVLLVVNPKTPCLSISVTGDAQFFTSRPKAYWTPKICDQTTCILPRTGTVSLRLLNIYGAPISYRINGGATVNVGAAEVTLTDSAFSNGSNTLEYWYTATPAVKRTRTIVKNPTHPSLSEPHGNRLWVDASGYSTVLSRITRAPYLSWYNVYKTRRDMNGQQDYDSNARIGKRWQGSWNLHGFNAALKNAFVAKVEGFNYTASGASKSFGRYAIEMLLDHARTIDPLGFEMSHTADSIPVRELHYRGYYDSVPLQESIFAYDIIAANFRSDQVTGGLTPIEDYFIRDVFAGFIYEAMQWGADFCIIGAPGMWGGARMATAAYMAMVMPEYSTPYYGTSGFGTVQTTYPLCPYQDDQYTWKQALFDDTGTRKSFPNLRWFAGWDKNGPSGAGNIVDMFFHEGEVDGRRKGDWRTKSAYYGGGLMGNHMMTWANMAKMWGGGKTCELFELSIGFAVAGTFTGAQDPQDQLGPYRFPMFLLCNSRWQNVVDANAEWIRSLPGTDNNSDDKQMQDAGVFGFSWYDDQIQGQVQGNAPSFVGGQPTAFTRVNAGSALSLTATASGTPTPTYQWRKNGTAIPGATSATLNLGTADLDEAGTYDCVATNSYGTATSNSAVIEVVAVLATPRPLKARNRRRWIG